MEMAVKLCNNEIINSHDFGQGRQDENGWYKLKNIGFCKKQLRIIKNITIVCFPFGKQIILVF